MYKNFPINKITITEEVGDDYIYYDELNSQKWEILNDTTQLLGYTCKKVTTNFRGRKYYAWYTEAIPVSNGPWKFQGLPGLILKVDDSQNYFSFNCNGIELPKNNYIWFNEDKKYVKISRLELMKLKRKRAEDPIGFSENYTGLEVKIDVPVEQRKNFKKPFNPMERTNE